MRILTSDERRAIDAARNELLEGIDLDSIKPIIAISAAHRSGFITGLDHSAAQLAALIAENTRLREALKPFAKVAESHSFAPSVPPEKCILWNKTSSIQGTLAEITLADCIEARRVLGEANDG